jgi:hypothetical protein
VILALAPWQGKLANLVAVHKLKLAVFFEVLVLKLPQETNLTLRVVRTLHYRLKASVFLVEEDLSLWHFKAAQVTHLRHFLTVRFQVTHEVQLNDIPSAIGANP